MRPVAGIAVALLALAGAACKQDVAPGQAAAGASVPPSMQALARGEWTYWGGNSLTTRYTPLTQINASNVNKLEVVWRWTADASGEAGSANYKSTPLMADGVLYVPWVSHGVAAIDGATGRTLWTFKPTPSALPGRAAGLASRSLSYWTDGTNKRLFHNSMDGRLISIDATTGRADPAFGRNGWVNLRDGLTTGRQVLDVGSVSPALVVGDIIVVQVIPGGGRNKESVPGNIRGYDVRTGRLVWTFHVIAQTGDPNNATWEGGSAEYTGHAGVWSMMSADPELGLVYLPTETPTNEFYGGHRLGNDLYAESLVCLDAKTGVRKWHFQMVHHGIWDYDNPTAPILHDIVQNGRTIKAVTQLTKQGLMFVFNRVTGEPIWPIEERPVPQSSIPGERTSPTQPFPTRPAPLLQTGYRESDLIDFTPELRREAVEIANQYTKGELYTVPSLVTATNRGTWMYPGTGGGPNWNGASVDPATNIMYVPIRRKPQMAALRQGDPRNTNLAYSGGGGGGPITGPRGLPILRPPYSEVVAVNMNTGEQLWRIPIGGASDFIRNHPALQGLNLDFDHMGQFDVKPAPLLTPQLLFLGESGNLGGGTGGPMFRAYDKVTGRTVWEHRLPNLVTGAPMTYAINGRQFIAMAVSSRGQPAEIVALALGDGVDDASVARPSPAPPGAAQGPRVPVTATPEELALGRTTFTRVCAGCHGPNGAGIPGGGAPPLTGRSDIEEMARVVREGAGEMPSLAAMLRPDEINAVVKFVAVGTGGGPRRPPADIED
jgi:quinoprotein glucose dehydrogenase